MESIKKAVVVFAVLVIGIGAALFFRKQPLEKTADPPAEAPIVLKDKKQNAGSPEEDSPQGVPLPEQTATNVVREQRPIAIEKQPGWYGRGQASGDSVAIAPQAPASDALVVTDKPIVARQGPPILPESFKQATRPPPPKLSDFADRQPGPFPARRPAPIIRDAPTDPARPAPVAAVPAPKRRPETAPIMVQPPAQIATQPTRYHTVVNGDSLARIAQRYLGDASRAGEIFALNRDVLSHPQVLPLGRRIKIPNQRGPDANPAAQQVAAAPIAIPKEEPRKQIVLPPTQVRIPAPRLVPLPPGSLSQQR